MKKLTLLSCLLLVVIKLNSQSFDGLIRYSNNYDSKDNNISSEQFNYLLGTKQIFAIKSGNYKSVFNGKFIKLQIYRSDENRNYSLTAKSDTLYYEDYSKNIDKALSYEIKKNQDTILGVPCDLIIVKSLNSTTSIYFNSKYSVDPEVYKNHKYGNWHYIISKTKSLPLKIINETDKFIMTSGATEIIPMKLEDNVFEIQNKDKIAPAYW
jgi:hypothetical protein